MRCRSCGAKYDGGICPKCGTYNDPKKAEPEPSKPMLAAAIALCIIAALLLAWLILQGVSGGSEQSVPDTSITTSSGVVDPEQDRSNEDAPSTPSASKEDALEKIDEIYSAIIDVDTMYEVLPQRLFDLTSSNMSETYSQLEVDENILNNATIAIYDIDDSGAESVSGAALNYIIDVDVYRAALMRYIENDGDSRILGDIQAAATEMEAGRDHFIEEEINYLVSAGYTQEEAKSCIYLGDYE
ncbi:MAG TPA: hypothetical protein H9845_00095 [Candidatus Agathobaculum pullicola]|nr:hypothetical protein [Candidatus Agathobaculum pullicola]